MQPHLKGQAFALMRDARKCPPLPYKRWLANCSRRNREHMLHEQAEDDYTTDLPTLTEGLACEGVE